MFAKHLPATPAPWFPNTSGRSNTATQSISSRSRASLGYCEYSSMSCSSAIPTAYSGLRIDTTRGVQGFHPRGSFQKTFFHEADQGRVRLFACRRSERVHDSDLAIQPRWSRRMPSVSPVPTTAPQTIAIVWRSPESVDGRSTPPILCGMLQVPPDGEGHAKHIRAVFALKQRRRAVLWSIGDSHTWPPPIFHGWASGLLRP
jgi:hypothetical protein